jgi:hypothetical protein
MGTVMGCHAQELTRAQAQELIQKTPQYQRFTLGILIKDAAEANCVQKSGLMRLSVQSAFGMALDTTAQVKLTPAGQQVIEKATFSQDPFEGVKLRIWFKSPPKLIVDEVTGISGALPEKVVEFKEHYDWSEVGLNPVVVASCFKSHLVSMDDKETLRLYDDGWRVIKANGQAVTK